MKVLVVGGGGREHALAWKVAQSPRVTKLYCAPGNPGIARIAECVPLAADDLAGLRDFARSQRIDLTVIGPEAPLAAGIVDEFRRDKLLIFGPHKAAARIEASKAFSKDLMVRLGIPTADAQTFTAVGPALAYVDQRDMPIVVKADGLAQGKGVVVAATHAEARYTVRAMLERNARLGDPEAQVVLPLVKTDLLEILTAVAEHRLDRLTVDWHERAAVCVVLAAPGYPGLPTKGIPIHGLAETEGQDDLLIFHAGTAGTPGGVVTAGGRVLGVTGLGDTVTVARERAYEGVRRIRFEGMHYRSDIGARALIKR